MLMCAKLPSERRDRKNTRKTSLIVIPTGHINACNEEPLPSSVVVGTTTLAVDGWAVTFDTAMTGPENDTQDQPIEHSFLTSFCRR